MTRHRKLLLWIAFASIPLAPLVLALVVALKPAPTEAARQIKRIQPGMTTDQVRAAIGNTNMIGVYDTFPFGKMNLRWSFPDGSALLVTFYNDRVIDLHEVIQESRPWYSRMRDGLRITALP